MTNQNFSLSRLLALCLTIAAPAAAHGYVQGIVAEGQFYQGYRPSFQYLATPPSVPGWSDPANINNGYISNYTSPDIICHLNATPGQAYATVKAGDTVTLQWTEWPSAHLGPVLTYMANCNGECTNVTKTDLLFNKIDAVGLIAASPNPGTWGSSELMANNNTWTVTIPSLIAPGNYVLRNEIIALQEAQALGGSQSFPQCVNIKVTGSGTNSLQSGTKGTQLYNAADPGLHIDIYQQLSNYTIPGPPLLSGLNSTATLPTAPFSNSTRTVVAGGFFEIVSTASISISTTTTSSLMMSTTTTGFTSSGTSSTTSTSASTTAGPTELLFAIQPATITLDLVNGALPTATTLVVNGTLESNMTATSTSVFQALVTGPAGTGTGSGYPFLNTTATSFTYAFPTLSGTITTTTTGTATTTAATSISASSSMTSTTTLSTSSFSVVPVTTAIEKRRHQRDFVQAPFIEVVEGDQRRRVY